MECAFIKTIRKQAYSDAYKMLLKLLSVNTQGLNDVIKRRAIFNFYRPKAEIILLQETHSTIESEIIWKAEWQGEILFSHGTGKARGICVLLPKGLMQKVTNIVKDTAGRIVKFDYSTNDELITICGIYAPNTDTPSFYNEIQRILTQGSNHKILLGDFNLVMNPIKDHIGSKINNEKSLAVIKEFSEEFLLNEIWRTKHENDRRFSWYGCKPRLVASRIDFALTSIGLGNRCVNTGYTTGLKTDHLTFYLFRDMTNNECGRGYWKLNVSHLRDKEYVDMMNNEISKIWAMCEGKPIFEKWEYFKFAVKDKSMDYARNKVAEIDLIVSQLSEKVDEMEQELEKANVDILIRTKADLDEFAQQKAKAYMFRSKVKYAEMGEKPTKYFFNMEKARYSARTCNALYDENKREMITVTKGILALQEQFYRDLYTSDQTISFNLENSFGLRVRAEERKKQSQPISLDELAKAAKQLPNGKTCGCDGIPIDFYKVFWPRIKDEYFELVKAIYNTKELHKSATLGIINLIPKATKN